jgi:hypothetical protein
VFHGLRDQFINNDFLEPQEGVGEAADDWRAEDVYWVAKYIVVCGVEGETALTSRRKGYSGFGDTDGGWRTYRYPGHRLESAIGRGRVGEVDQEDEYDGDSGENSGPYAARTSDDRS